MRIDIDGIELHYDVRGQGEPLLLLHGLTGAADDWQHAGIDRLSERHRTIAMDARGHGRSTGWSAPASIRRHARDVLALLDHLAIDRCKAIGLSLGGNTLLHVATMAPDRIEAMVVVSATMYFPEQARALMRAVPPDPPEEQRRLLAARHVRGDEQVAAVWRMQRTIADDCEDLSFTPPSLSRIRARTLVVYGDRDPLYPVDMAVDMARAIPDAALWIVPNAGHVPVFLDAAPRFVETSLAFLA